MYKTEQDASPSRKDRGEEKGEKKFGPQNRVPVPHIIQMGGCHSLVVHSGCECVWKCTNRGEYSVFLRLFSRLEMNNFRFWKKTRQTTRKLPIARAQKGPGVQKFGSQSRNGDQIKKRETDKHTRNGPWKWTPFCDTEPAGEGRKRSFFKTDKK